jgi:hypothetical protein
MCAPVRLSCMGCNLPRSLLDTLSLQEDRGMGRQLRIAHLVINSNTSTTRIHMKGYYHATYHHIIQELYTSAQYITSIKVKQDTSFAVYRNYVDRGLPYSKEKVSIHDASRGCPPSSTKTSSSCGKPPATMGLHAMTCVFY